MEIYEMLVQVLSTEVVRWKCVYKPLKCFSWQEGKTEDKPLAIDKQKPRNERASATHAGTRLSTDATYDGREISKNTVHTIIHDDLGKCSKICFQFVPHMLIDDQKVKLLKNK